MDCDQNPERFEEGALKFFLNLLRSGNQKVIVTFRETKTKEDTERKEMWLQFYKQPLSEFGLKILKNNTPDLVLETNGGVSFCWQTREKESNWCRLIYPQPRALPFKAGPEKVRIIVQVGTNPNDLVLKLHPGNRYLGAALKLACTYFRLQSLVQSYVGLVTNKLINDGCNSDLKYLYSALIEGRLIILSLGGDKPFEFQSVKSHLNQTELNKAQKNMTRPERKKFKTALKELGLTIDQALNSKKPDVLKLFQEHLPELHIYRTYELDKGAKAVKQLEKPGMIKEEAKEKEE